MANQELPISWKKAGTVIHGLSLFAIALAVFALYEQRRALKAQHEWNRRHYTVQMISEFNSQIGPFRNSLRKATPTIYLKGASTSLSPERAKEIKRADPNSNDEKIRKDLAGVYNYMEYVCTAYEANIVDRERVYEAYHRFFIRTYDNLKRLFEQFELEQHGQPHESPITRVITQWKSKDVGNKEDPPTG